jgi:HEAT repeat protein
MQEKIIDLVARLKHCRTLPEIREACGAVGEKTDLVHLLTEVLGSDEMSVRWKAAVALSEIGPPAVQDLIECLSDMRAYVRSSAAWVLGNIGDQRATPALQRNLEDPSPDVRKEAAEALGKLVEVPGHLPRKNGTQGISVPT